MKKITLFLSAAIFAAVVLVSCSGGTKDAKSVATEWVADFAKFDFEAAKKLSGPEVVKYLTMVTDMFSKLPDAEKEQAKKATLAVKDVKEEGDKATATCTNSQRPDKDMTLTLTKTDGKWLVTDMK